MSTMRVFDGFHCGMGIGGWLTNYKRFNVLPDKWRGPLSPGDFEHFDTYITEADVRNIAGFGVDHVRLAFDQIVLEEAPGIYRERTFRLVDAFIEWCEKAGLNVVLNLHKAVGNYCDIQEKVSLLDDAELQDRFIAFWLEFERRYHDKPGVAFELLNEVRDVESNLWNDLARQTVERLRRANPVRGIVIGSTCWNSPKKLDCLHLYDDRNVIYTFHMYSPFEFTHQQGVLMAGPLYYNRKMAYPSDIEPYRDYSRFVNDDKNPYPNDERVDKAWLCKRLQPAFDFVAAHPDKTLWCGEFGTIRHCRQEYRENWMRDVISLLMEHGIPYCVWNYLSTPNDGNRFSLVDDDTRAILSPRMLRVIQGREEKTMWHPSQDTAWELTFEDNFEGNKLDETKWFPGYRLGRVEYYNRIGFPNAHTRGWQPNPPLAHYVIEDGVLHLRVDKDTPMRDKPATKTVSAVTSAIYRYDEAPNDFKDEVKFSQKHGWWEMRCRMPVCGSGAYTAFWLHQVGARNQEYSPEGVRQGNPVGASPAVEIDIFEWVGKSPDKNLFNVHFTKNGYKAFSCPCDLTKDFHTWAINWEQGRITWHLDGGPIHTYEGPTPEGEMYLLMAMFQIGGWVGEIAEDLPYPLDFEIDYVKVWKKK